MLAVILRSWAIVCAVLAIVLTAAGLLEPTKLWLDLMARLFLWPTLALLCWAVAEALDRCTERTNGGSHAPVR